MNRTEILSELWRVVAHDVLFASLSNSDDNTLRSDDDSRLEKCSPGVLD